MMPRTVRPPTGLTREQLEARRQELQALAEDAREVIALQAHPGWQRLRRLIDAQIEQFRGELENPQDSVESLRGLQWQIHALRWILELPDALARKLADERLLDEKTVPAGPAEEERTP